MASQYVPLVDLNASWSFEQQHPISGQAIINQFNIAPIKTFVPELSALKGFINADIHFNGPANKPNIDGKLALNADQLIVMVPPHVTATVAPHLTVTLRERLIKITLNINRLYRKLLVKKLPEGSVSISDDVVFFDDNGNEIKKRHDSSLKQISPSILLIVLKLKDKVLKGN